MYYIWDGELLTEDHGAQQTFPIPIVLPAIIKHKKYLSIDVTHGFRFGNRLFDLLSLYGLADILNREPLFYVQDHEFREMIPFIGKILPGIFKKLTILDGRLPSHMRRVQFQGLCCTFEDPSRFATLPDEHLHLAGQFYQSYKYFHHLRPEIMKFLRPPRDFPHLPKSDERNPMLLLVQDKHELLCIHVRRTDFLDGHRQAPDQDFIKRAAELIEQREYSNTDRKMKIVIFGDDVQFEKEIFPDAVVAYSRSRPSDTTRVYVSTNKPEDDLLYASLHCDIVFISAAVSTYGWWMAYLTRQNKAYYVDIRFTNDLTYRSGMMTPEDYYPSSWTPLRLAKDKQVVVSEIADRHTKL